MIRDISVGSCGLCGGVTIESGRRTNMARVGIIFGLLLCGLTVAGLLRTPVKHPMQFIPMMLGIPVLFCGVVALNPHRRKHAMHAASAVALLGAVAGCARVAYCLIGFAGGAEVNGDAFKLAIAMSVICAVFVAICVVSFAQTRKRKTLIARSESGQTMNTGPPATNDAAVTDAKSRESA